MSVKFSPKYAGPRNGAVVLKNSGGAVVATAYVYGIGLGPLVAFNYYSDNTSLIVTPWGLSGLAVDGAGAVYFAAYGSALPAGVVKKAPLGCASQTCMQSLGGGFNSPSDIAIDGGGNIYVADSGNALKEVPAGCGSSACVTTLVGGLTNLGSVAVDGSGNFFITVNGEVKEMPAGCASSACMTTLGGGFNRPAGIAVDGGGNVYVADNQNQAVKKMPAGCASAACVTTLFSDPLNLVDPRSIAVDASGDVYTTFSVISGHDVGVEIPSGCTSSACVFPLAPGSYGITLDGSGNVYSTEGSGDVVETLRSTPPSLTFAPTPIGRTSDDSPQTVIVQNIGTAGLDITNVMYPADFPEATGVESDCTGTTPLVSSAFCTLSINFSPLASSATGPTTPLSESVSLTVDHLNGTKVVQSVAVSGTATIPNPYITSPSPGTVLGGNSIFTWFPGFGVTGFQLYIGTTGPGSTDVYWGPTLPGTATSSGSVYIPLNSAVLYVRFWYQQNNAWQHVDSTYLEGSRTPYITSPEPGSQIQTGGNNHFNFTWVSDPSVSQFQLYAGTTGPGSSDIYRGPNLPGTATSSGAILIPPSGKALYVRLWYLQNNAWLYHDYTYLEASSTPYLTGPAPGTVLSGPTIFTWYPGSGVTGFQIYAGTTGAGSSDLYRGPDLPGTATSSAAIHIPANGATLYVRFWYQLSGSWQYLDYIYTEAGTTPVITSPTPAMALGGNTIFTWSPGPGADQFALYVGTAGPGSTDIYWGPNLAGTATSSGSVYIPLNDATLYVRFWYLISGTWQYHDYTYREASARPYIVTPAPGTAIGGPTTFTWNGSGVGATAYQLYVGTTGAGSSNIYRGPDLPGSASSSAPITIPTSGGIVYVRLWYVVNSTWLHQDYTYFESSATPYIIGPAPGTAIGPYSIFTWWPGSGVQQFQLYAGTTGPGSTDVYLGPNLPGTATSSDAIYIPPGTTTLYLRFWYLKNNAWQHQDYTYAAQ